MELSMYGAYTNGTDIWMPSENMNALFYQDLTKPEGAKYLCSFESGKLSNTWKIGNVIYFNDNLFFFSLHTYEVWILNLDTKEMNRVSYCSDQGSFIPDIIKVDNEAWIIPRSFKNPIIIFNLLTWQSEKIDWESQDNISDEYSFTNACTYNGQIFFSTRTCGKIHICKINCQDRKVCFQKIHNINFINCLTVYQEKIFALVLNSDGKALLKQYDLSNMMEEYSVELKEIDSSWEDEHMFYFRMISYRNNIIILPSLAKNIVVYNKDKKEEISVSLPKEFVYRKRNKNEPYFRKTDLSEGTLYLYPAYGKHLLSLNLASMEFEKYEIFCQEEEFWSKYTKRADSAKEIIEETAHISIENYLSYVENRAEKNKVDLEYRPEKSIYNSLQKYSYF